MQIGAHIALSSGFFHSYNEPSFYYRPYWKRNCLLSPTNQIVVALSFLVTKKFFCWTLYI